MMHKQAENSSRTINSTAVGKIHFRRLKGRILPRHFFSRKMIIMGKNELSRMARQQKKMRNFAEWMKILPQPVAQKSHLQNETFHAFMVFPEFSSLCWRKKMASE